MKINDLISAVENSKAASAWARGVKLYALDLLEGLEDDIRHGYFDADDLGRRKILYEALLNGAPNWTAYSWGGCALIYNADIAKRLCTPSELKKTDGGCKSPNANEEWLDVQARALYQAWLLVSRAHYELSKKEV